MAYATTNPPKLLMHGVGSAQPSLWVYTSGDVHTDVDATDYFTDAEDRGMKVGDIVYVVNSAASAYTVTTHAVAAIDTDGKGTLSAAVLV